MAIYKFIKDTNVAWSNTSLGPNAKTYISSWKVGDEIAGAASPFGDSNIILTTAMGDMPNFEAMGESWLPIPAENLSGGYMPRDTYTVDKPSTITAPSGTALGVTNTTASSSLLTSKNIIIGIVIIIAAYFLYKKFKK
jgi:hypothetical protein